MQLPYMCVNCGRVIAYCNGGSPGQKCVWCFHGTGRCKCPYCPQEYYEISHVHTALMQAASAQVVQPGCGCGSKQTLPAGGIGDTNSSVLSGSASAQPFTGYQPSLGGVGGEQLQLMQAFAAFLSSARHASSFQPEPVVTYATAAQPAAPIVAESDIKFRKDAPEAVRQLVSLLFNGRIASDRVEAKDIPAIVLKELNKFAAEASGVADCTVNAIYGCGSCCNAPNARANLVSTTCGWQCWNCYGLCDEALDTAPRTLAIGAQVVQLNGQDATIVGTAVATSGCEGNACGAVSIDPKPGGGYWLRNRGGQRVRVRIRWTFGFQCLDWTDIDLNPGETKAWGNGGYCHPWYANYI